MAGSLPVRLSFAVALIWSSSCSTVPRETPAAALIPQEAPAPSSEGGRLRVGYIDSNRIMREFAEVRAVESQLDDETRLLEAEYSSYLARLDSLQTEFERERLLLSPAKVGEKEQAIRDLQRTLRDFQQEKFGPDGELYRTQARLMSPILERIDAAVKKIGAERQYDYILDTVGGALVYAVPGHDLTADVLRELHQAAATQKAKE